MKYCFDWNTNNDKFILSKADEIVISYFDYLPDLPKFLEKIVNSLSLTQRIILDASQCSNENFEKSMPIFKAAIKIHPNIAFKVLRKKIDDIQSLSEHLNVNYFYYNLARTREDFEKYVKEGVSDVYVVEDLGFQFHKLYAEFPNINIRLFSNVAQSKDYSSVALNSFFIRPEDLHLYDRERVVIEFWGPIDRQKVNYNIYTSGEWRGKLNKLIYGASDIFNYNLLPVFGSIRATCLKDCENCKFCEESELIAMRIEKILNGALNDSSEKS